MSIDAYFCFCCLSTEDLLNLFDFNSEENYAQLLQDIFFIEPFEADYIDDSYICKSCAQFLKQADTFKKQVVSTLAVLQSNGLINTEINNNYRIIRKVTNPISEDKKNLLEEENEENFEKEQNATISNAISSKTTQVKIENVSENKYPPDNASLDTLNQKHETSKSDSETSEVENKTDSLQCQECMKMLPNAYMYHRHMNEHFPNHICDTCGKGFLSEKKLKRHLTSHMTGVFECDACEAQFNNYNSMISHRRRKHNPSYTKPKRTSVTGCYECSTCGKIYTTVGSLYAHRRSTHSIRRRYFCSRCAHSFYHRQDLLAHENAHAPDNMFACQLCRKSYLRKKALIVHMRTHTDDRRFTCDVCGRRFIQKCTLMAHVKTHNTATES